MANNKLYFAKDAYFKSIIKNKNLLAYILKNFIEEYKNLKKEEIISLLTLHGLVKNESQEILSLDSEINDPVDGKIFLDKVIGVYLPNKKEQIGILLDFEMQTKEEKVEKMYNRAEYYVSALMRSQKKVVFNHMDYEDMSKVSGIWFCLHKGEPAVNLYTTKEVNEVGNYSLDKRIYDKRNIKFIYIGSEETDSVVEPLRILFNSKMPAVEILQILKEKYDIDLYEKKEEVNTMCDAKEYYKEFWEEELSEKMERLEKLQEKVERSQEKLKKTQEKLKKTQEEVQKSKEEVQKSKEEVQKSKEELEKAQEKFKKTQQEVEKSKEEVKKRTESILAKGRVLKLIENITTLMETTSESYEKVCALLRLNEIETKTYRNLVLNDESM